MSEPVVVPGSRDVRGALDSPEADATVCVVACPPHPQHGGNRSDARLRAVSGALTDRGLACLRFDCGPWTGGEGERTDAKNAIEWARERHERVGLFGYSFGATCALLVAAEDSVAAVGALAPHRGEEWSSADAAAALDRIDIPIQVLYGSRDVTVDWEPVVERARARVEAGHDVSVVELSADHFFVGQEDAVAEHVAGFFVTHLG